MRKGQDNWGGTCPLVNNLEVSHEGGKDEIVIKTKGTNRWPFVTQIFYNGEPCHGGYCI